MKWPIWTASSKKMPLSTCKMHRLSNVCAKSHPCLCPFIHSVVSNDSVSGQWRPWSDCMDVQIDLGFCCPHMSEDTFLQGTAQINSRQCNVCKRIKSARKCSRWPARKLLFSFFHSLFRNERFLLQYTQMKLTRKRSEQFKKEVSKRDNCISF